MSMIQVRNLTFSYEGSPEPVFENVSFCIDTDWKLGFTGRNGRGKTTFLKLLMKEYEYGGSIQADAVFDYFPFSPENEEQDTILVAGEVCPDYDYWRLVKELSRLKVEEEVLFRPFNTLSQGERTKILLALFFLKEEHFLLIDEPTNHLDQEGREVMAEYLSRKRGFILVSHDRAFLDRAVDHMLVINKNSIQVQKGNFSSWYSNKQKQDAFEEGENEKRRKEIRRLSAAAERTERWANQAESLKLGKKGAAVFGIDRPNRDYLGEKSRKMQQRRKNLEKRREAAVQKKKELLHDVESAEELKLFPGVWRQERLIWMREGRIAYGERTILSNVNLEIRRGERLVLQGSNGCGKSSILKAILQMVGAGGTESAGSGAESCGAFGHLRYEGEMYLGAGMEISYVSQDTSGLSGSLSDYAVREGVEESLLKSLLRKLDFSREQLSRPMETFSQGQKKKVLLAASLCRQAHLYLWDEPLNYIDVFSRMQIEALIARFQPTMVLIEHDRAFTEKVGSRFIQVRDFFASADERVSLGKRR